LAPGMRWNRQNRVIARKIHGRQAGREIDLVIAFRALDRPYVAADCESELGVHCEGAPWFPGTVSLPTKTVVASQGF